MMGLAPEVGEVHLTSRNWTLESDLFDETDSVDRDVSDYECCRQRN